MFDMKLGIEVSEFFIVKLLAIDGDDDSREAESTDDELPYEFFGFGFGDLGHRIGFHPFGEVVNTYEQEFLLC